MNNNTTTTTTTRNTKYEIQNTKYKIKSLNMELANTIYVFDNNNNIFEF